MITLSLFVPREIPPVEWGISGAESYSEKANEEINPSLFLSFWIQSYTHSRTNTGKNPTPIMVERKTKSFRTRIVQFDREKNVRTTELEIHSPLQIFISLQSYKGV